MASLLTMVFTDVVESSATKREVSLGRDSGERDRAYLEKVQMRHFNLVRDCCRQHAGREVSTMGDAFFLTFEDPVQAVRCAVDIQKRLTIEPIETPRGPLRLRIGMHSGFPEVFEGSYHGTDVDKAARVEATATAQQILLSSTTYELVQHMTDVKFWLKGEFELKGVGRVALREATWDTSKPRPTAVPPLATQKRISVEISAKHGGLLLGGGALVLLAILALTIPTTRNFILRRQPATATTTGLGIPSLAQGKYLAVLPFRVLGDTGQLGYMAEGLGDALSTKLFQLKDIHVATPGAADQTGPQESAQKIARQLGANLLVEGTLQSGGGKVAIFVSLMEAASGQRRWANEFSGVPQDLLTLEDDIYTKLVAALELKPGYVEEARATMHPTENTAAYDLYLKGKQAMRGRQNPDNVTKAIGYYNDALQNDPNFALAYAGLVDASLAMYEQKKDSFWADKALAAAERAQQLNDGLAEVHFALGSVYMATGKTDEAIIELDRAITLSPRSDEAYRRLGGAYLSKGRKDEAIQAHQKALQLNPYYWLNYNALGLTYLQTGDNEKALKMFSKVTELEPDNVMGYENVGAVYLAEGQYDKCIPVFQKALQLQPTDVNYSNLGTAYFYLKRYTDAVPMFEKAVQLNPNEEVNMGNLADAYRWSGQKEKASATYDKAIALAYKDLSVNPRKSDTMDDLARYYARKGDTAQALQFIRRSREIDGSNVESIYDEGTIQAIAGRTSEALKALRVAFERGYSTRQALNDPDLESLRGNAEFGALIKEFSDKPK